MAGPSHSEKTSKKLKQNIWMVITRVNSLYSEQGVQQGDPLGPLLFTLVLNKVVNHR